MPLRAKGREKINDSKKFYKLFVLRSVNRLAIVPKHPPVAGFPDKAIEQLNRLIRTEQLEDCKPNEFKWKSF